MNLKHQCFLEIALVLLFFVQQDIRMINRTNYFTYANFPTLAHESILNPDEDLEYLENKLLTNFSHKLNHKYFRYTNKRDVLLWRVI